MLFVLLAIVLALVLWARLLNAPRAQAQMDAATFVSTAVQWRETA